jgi:hypothetical protein
LKKLLVLDENRKRKDREDMGGRPGKGEVARENVFQFSYMSFYGLGKAWKVLCQVLLWSMASTRRNQGSPSFPFSPAALG